MEPLSQGSPSTGAEAGVHAHAHAQTPASTPLLTAHELTLTYGGFAALAGVSLELRAGEILAVVGANGCGKSSLLRVLAQLGGAGRVGGRVCYAARAGASVGASTSGATSASASTSSSSSSSSSSLAAVRAFVPQRPEVSAAFTAREVVRLGRFSVGRDESAVERALEAVGLSARAALSFHTLSGGERQRVAIARALAQLDQPAGRAGVLILDEPFGGIDPGEVARIARALQARADGGAAVVLSLHDPGLARAIATTALVMKAGRAIAAGAAGEVLTASCLGDAYGHPMRDADGWIVPELAPRARPAR